MASIGTRLAKPLRRARRQPETRERIERLTRANRSKPSVEVERELLRLRHSGFAELESEPRPPQDDGALERPAEQEFELEHGVPVIDRSEADAGTVRAAISRYGSLRVRKLVSEETAERLKDGIDGTFDASAAFWTAKDAGEMPAFERSPQAALYHPFRPLPGYTLGGGRNWSKNGSSIWAADSPRLMFELIDEFERSGISRLCTDYLGERPALSMNKCVLRRVAADGAGGADWHQDGAFLGEQIRSLNVWLALTPCGENAPGMDVVGRRLDGIVPTGSEGASFDWSVAPAEAERAAGEAGIVRPVFETGDALLFDHLMLHRTAAEATMTEKRYAIETWFFAPSAYPDKQVPLVL